MSANPKPVPPWQQLSGLFPDKEWAMSDEERDDAIRKLLGKVNEATRAELARPTPEGERTAFWEPIQRVCFRLQISRSKLSRYSKELTGLAAHEISDKIMAEDLPARVEAHLKYLLQHLPEMIAKGMGQFHRLTQDLRRHWMQRALDIAEGRRTGSAASHWAETLKFASVPRLRRACRLANGCSIDTLEERLVRQLVQKMFDDFDAERAGRCKDLPAWLQHSDEVGMTGWSLEKWWELFQRWPTDPAEAHRMKKESIDNDPLNKI